MKSIPVGYSGVTASPRAIYPSSRHGWYLLLLLVSKALLCISMLLTYNLLQTFSAVGLVCSLKLAAGVMMVYAHRPGLTGGRLSRAQGVGLLQLAILGAVHSALLLHGLWLCGPFRAVLVTQHHDAAFLAALTTLFSGGGGPARTRGVAFFVAAVVTLLFLDHDESRQHLGDGHVFLGASSWLGLADHKLGVVLLLAVLVARVGLCALARRLTPVVGGPKSLHAVCTLLEGVVLLPWATVLLFTQDDGSSIFATDHLFQFFAVVFIYLISYYADAVCSQRLDVQQVARVGSVGVFVCALVVAMVWPGPTQPPDTAVDHLLSGGGMLACILFILSTLGLTSGSRVSAQGSLVGFSSSGLPLYTLTNSALHQSSRSMVRLLASTLRHILDNSNSRRIFYFLCLNLSFMLVEFAYGLCTNSLGLISDAFHMLFDCSALILGLLAAVLARRKPSKTFSFGYGRVEDLFGFVNGLFLVVVSMLVLWEAISRLPDPPHINTQRLLAVSIAGLVVNLVGILAFRHTHGSHGTHSHSHNANMEGVFLHVVADTLGSVGVIVSSLLIDQFGWFVADPICSLFIAVLIFLSVLPLLKRSAAILLLSVPVHIRKRIPHVLEQVVAVEGVLGVGQQFYWSHSVDTHMAMVHVRAEPHASEQSILQQVTGILKQAGFYQLCVQVQKDSPSLPTAGHANSLLLIKAI